METLLYAIAIGLFVYGVYKLEDNRYQNSRPLYRKYRKKLSNYNITGSLLEDFIVLDFETTGLDASINEIVEIGAIKFKGLKEIDRFYTYVKPVIPITPEATRINNITNHMLRNAPNFDEVSNQLIDFIGDNLIVAHNVSFDLTFLQTSLGYEISNLVTDTLMISRKVIFDIENYKLETLKKYLGLNVTSHSALGDCEVTAQVYLHCRNILEKIENDKEEFQQTERGRYLKVVSEILNQHNIKTGPLRCTEYDNGLAIYLESCTLIYFFKLGGRLQYWSVNIPFNNFAENYPCSFKITPECKSSGGDNATRIFIKSPDDLFELEQLVVDEYYKAEKIYIHS